METWYVPFTEFFNTTVSGICEKYILILKVHSTRNEYYKQTEVQSRTYLCILNGEMEYHV